jgi:hypothetical protein
MSDLERLTLSDGAVVMHELFLTYLAAGFTENQALKLVAYLLVANKIGEDNNGN